jgi:hypothetical protein
MLRAETIFSPAERVRHAFLATVARASPALVAKRDLRVAVGATGLVLLAFLLTATAPRWLLLVGPIVLGIPHVVADVRYLVARPRLHARPLLWLLVAAPLVWCALGGGVRAGAVATCGAFLAARGARWLRVVGVCAGVVLFTIAARLGSTVDVAFAHLHNFAAVAIWLAWRKRVGNAHLVPLLVFATCALLFLVGAATPTVTGYPYEVGDGMVPAAWAAIGARLISLFAFAQAVHYSVWLRLIPEDDRQQPTPRPWAASFRAMLADVGRWVAVASVFAAVGLAVYALSDLVAARALYLRAVVFHGHLEMAALALLFVERRLPLDGAARAS